MYRSVLKIGFIGTENVGKTLLCNKISGRKLERGYIATIGVDLIIKYLNINDEKISVLLWDYAGKKIFESIVKRYTTKCDILFFCYSANDYSSFEYIFNKINEFNINNLINNKTVVIIATKTDSEDVHENYDKWFLKLDQILKDKKYTFFKTSVYNDIGIDELNNQIYNWCNIKINNKETYASDIVPKINKNKCCKHMCIIT